MRLLFAKLMSILMRHRAAFLRLGLLLLSGSARRLAGAAEHDTEAYAQLAPVLVLEQVRRGRRGGRRGRA
jgi:hypothetical protein